jgi:hypothetical protein
MLLLYRVGKTTAGMPKVGSMTRKTGKLDANLAMS